jgi:hypothetical protein
MLAQPRQTATFNAYLVFDPTSTSDLSIRRSLNGKDFVNSACSESARDFGRFPVLVY